MSFEPVREAAEFRAQLSSDKRRLAFLFGAGASQAVGIPGLASLSGQVTGLLTGDEVRHYERIISREASGSVETVLNHLRLCRELLASSKDATFDELNLESSAGLDRSVCRAIRTLVGGDPPGGIVPHFILANWLKTISRAFPVEVFTTNYDLLLERALESAEAPYFDGFVGTVSPFFRATTIDADFAGSPLPSVPRDWIRLWKLHGSIGWVLSKDPLTMSERIVRRGDFVPGDRDELMVYPSRQKYSDSRRLPFLAYQDRLRRLLGSGEALLITCGYSFADQHLNDIIFQSLRSNPRLAVTALSYEPLTSQSVKTQLLEPAGGIPNLTIYGPDLASVGGRVAPWSAPAHRPPVGDGWQFWDKEKGQFLLGGFRQFVDFLSAFLGARAPSLPTEIATDAK